MTEVSGDLPFQTLQNDIALSGPQEALERLAQRLKAAQRYDELFDLRLMQARFRHGLPVISPRSVEGMPISFQEETTAACGEVGELLLGEGRYRDALTYLQAGGNEEPIRKAIASVDPNDENLDELIEVAIYEGVDPSRGFGWVLDRRGTCNAVTMFEGMIGQQPPDLLREPAEMLVRRIHHDVLENVRSHISREKGEKAAGGTLANLAQEHAWIFEGENYHVDTSHLSSIVRFSRLIETSDFVRQAWELTEYGRRLDPEYQLPGEEPFTKFYESHGLLLAATLGQKVEEAVAFFRERAENTDLEADGTTAIETYVILLARLGRSSEAMEAIARLVPRGIQLSGFAPGMARLAVAGSVMPRYLEICRQRDDLLAYAAGLLHDYRA